MMILYDSKIMLGKKEKSCFVVCIKDEAVCHVWADDDYRAIETAKDNISTDIDVENKDWTAYEFNEYHRLFDGSIEMNER